MCGAVIRMEGNSRLSIREQAETRIFYPQTRLEKPGKHTARSVTIPKTPVHVHPCP